MLSSNGTIRRTWSYLLLLSLGIILFYAGVYTNSNSKCHHLHFNNVIDSIPIISGIFDNLNKSDNINASKSKPFLKTIDGLISNSNQKLLNFKDGHKHLHDTRDAYEQISEKIKILCWIMTSPNNHRSKALHVQATWGKRCDKLIFISEKDDPLLPIIKVDSGSGRDHLTAKTMMAFHAIYEKHLNKFDWFMKADDDTYVIVENLKYFLTSEDPRKPIFFGHHFKPYVKQGYFSGGAGYILSREALKRFGKRAKTKCSTDGGAEDVEMGRCMDNLGIKTGDSRDALGRSRFHCFNPATHIHGGYPDWYMAYDKNGAKKGIDSISDYAISFHYMTPEEMYNMEFFIYHLRPFGIITGLQELNRPRNGQINEPIESTASYIITSKPKINTALSQIFVNTIIPSILRTTPPQTLHYKGVTITGAK